MEHSLYVDEGRMEPLQLGYLAGASPEDVDIKLYDDRCEPIPYDEETDLAAITVETYTARRAYEIAAEYRRRGVRVILGGFQPTLIPEEAGEHADSIVTGDAESVWTEILSDARSNRERREVYATIATINDGNHPTVGATAPMHNGVVASEIRTSFRALTQHGSE